MKSLALTFAIGLALGLTVPSGYSLGASAELVAFVTLIMAGLLPAMILTATVIRGDQFSSSRVREYGAALRKQLDFWAFLFLCAIVSVFCISAAKVVVNAHEVPINLGTFSLLPVEAICRLLVGIGFGALATVLGRLWPAYAGLRSLLSLTVQMAELQALANDRSLRNALGAKASRDYSEPQPAPWPDNAPHDAEH